MSDWKTIVSSVLATAKAVLPALVPGSAVPIAVAQKVLDVVNEVAASPHLTSDQIAEIGVTQAELEAAVNAHAERTKASLGDG